MSASPDPRTWQGRERRSRCARLAGTSGFTLVEVLVAFTVMAMLLAVLHRGVIGMRAGVHAFDHRTQEENVARAVFAETTLRRNVAAGLHHGKDSGLAWQLLAKPIDLSGQLPPPAPELTEQKAGAAPGQAGQPEPDQPPAGARKEEPSWVLQRVTVEIGSRGKPLAIETIRMVKAAEDAK